MVKKNVKARKRLAKLVLAALLCSGWAQSFSTSVAEAAYPPNEANRGFATVSKTGGESFEVTSSDTNTLGNTYMRINTSDRQYLLKGNGLYEAKAKQGTITSSDDNGALLSTSADGYTVTVSKDGLWGGVYGAWLNSSEASTVGGDTGNKVEFEAGYANKVIGGRGQIGTVKGNTVVISGGATAQAFGGQVYEGNAEGNTVQITGGEVGGRPICMYTSGGITWPYYSGGKLVPQRPISASTENAWDDEFSTSIIVGGYSYSGNAVNNAVVFDGGTVIATDESQYLGGDDDVTGSTIIGGYSMNGAALGNTVTFGSDAKADFPYVYGGLGKTEASGNTVTVKSRDIKGGIFVGGVADSKVNDNTVNILASVNPGILFGSMNLDGGKVSGASGNTLNVAAKNVSSYVVAGFQNMNFYLPEDIANGDTMLTIKSPKTVDEWFGRFGNHIGAGVILTKYGKSISNTDLDADGNILAKPLPTNLTGVTFGVAALSGVNLQKGDTVNLIVDENGLTTDDELTVDNSKLAEASFLAPNNLATDKKYELSISKKDANTIITTVEDVKEVTPDPEPEPEPKPKPKPKPDYSHNERLKSLVETRAGMATMINAGTDLLTGQGMSNAAEAAADTKAGGDFDAFGAVSVGKLRAKSGSHVDTKGIGLNLGFAREIENKSGKLLFGPVVEYGHGKYDSYQDNGIKADGNTSYWGLGLIAKQTNNNGMYYEGSIRGGRVKADYDSDLSAVTHASYDSKATYWAAHLGIGKVMDAGRDNTLDVYGKYFYSRTGSDSVTVHATAGDEDVHFDAVNSHRLRIGTRLTHALNERNKLYGGLAWQYEFNGEARATYNGGATPSPTVKGSSGLIELGWQVKPGKGTMAIDFGVTGWVGKQRGITANLQANWTF